MRERNKSESKGIIKEIIVENFMSYEYARIPFRPGINIVCGPNGSGKSSILLALAVALGQTYTERSKRLSDLIRRGKDLARITVAFDNAPDGGKRPIVSSRSDDFILSRYLKRDGTYWYEVGFHSASKAEVLRILSRLNINPDNMLIIMHQNMIEEFSVIDHKEKLRMVEEAVGLAEYREKIFEVRENLSHILSEEEAVETMLEKAGETLNHWRSEYERYQRKRRLLESKRRLAVEYAWSNCIRLENNVQALSTKLRQMEEEMSEIELDLEGIREAKETSKAKSAELDYNLEQRYHSMIIYERGNAEAQTEIRLHGVYVDLFKGKNPPSDLSHLQLNIYESERRLRKTEAEIKSLRASIVKLRSEIEKQRERYINSRIREAILEFRRTLITKEISHLQVEIRRITRELKDLEKSAETLGSRIETSRSPFEVLDEIKMVNIHLSGLTDVSSDAEKMYTKYKDFLEELRQKAQVAASNRKRALKELEFRERKWRENVSHLLSGVGETYRKILGDVDAAGDVRLIDPEEVDEAGLELLVGFRGAAPTVLDAHTQSGGERTTAIMCFLLALQQHIKSPIRAVDEFDIHMDPRNREHVMRQIFRHTSGTGQYIIITPGQIVDAQGRPNIIAVQNVAGSSKVSVMTRS